MHPDRTELISHLEKPGNPVDVLVVGGGATGLGIALDAAARGYSVILLEQHDFAKGTSSRSTKLVHGGVRYLASGDLKLVREATVERGLLTRNAPHLVKNQSFIIPLYNWADRIKYYIGLKLYDWISGSLSLGSSTFVNRADTLKLIAGIREQGLIGGIRYQDGQFNDSRLAINLVQTILERGGIALNYVRIAGLQKTEHGKISGITATDMETGLSYTISAKAVVNATGVFVDDILQMDRPGTQKTVCVSQGAHLVVDRKFYPSDYALLIPQTSDGRVLFAVPWQGKVVLGTTDTPVSEPSLEPVALEKEIEFILRTAGTYLHPSPSRKDVLSVFAGLRPLAAPKEGGKKTKEISRSHKIIVSSSGLFTMLGGKWTTFRKMGEEMVNKIETTLEWPHRPPATENLPIHGAGMLIEVEPSLLVYGTDAAEIFRNLPGEKELLSEPLHIYKAEVHWAVEKEMARTVEDFLARRTRALFLDAAESVRMAPGVAAIMAELLQKDAAWIKAQIDDFEKLAANYQL